MDATLQSKGTTVTSSMKRPTARLDRTTFTTSRLLDFCSEKELTAQTGHAVQTGRWSSSRNSSTTRSTPARRQASRRRSRSASTIRHLDRRQRSRPAGADGQVDPRLLVSHVSREAYVSPTRGAQGNALKTHRRHALRAFGRRARRRRDRQRRASGIASSSPSTRSASSRRSAMRSSRPTGKTAPRSIVHWPLLACSILDRCQGAFFTNRRRLHLAQPAPDAHRRLVRRSARRPRRRSRLEQMEAVRSDLAALVYAGALRQADRRLCRP